MEIKDKMQRTTLRSSIKLDNDLKLKIILKEEEKLWDIRAKATTQKVVKPNTLVPQYMNMTETSKP